MQKTFFFGGSAGTGTIFETGTEFSDGNECEFEIFLTDGQFDSAVTKDIYEDGKKIGIAIKIIGCFELAEFKALMNKFKMQESDALIETKP